MSTHKHIDIICIAVMICAILLTVLFMNGESLGIQVLVDEDAENYTGTEYFTANDQNGTWSDEDATKITLNGDTAKVSGSGAYVNDGSVYITASGRYTITGTLTDGSIVVDAYDNSKVWIMLDGVDVTCSDDAAFRVDQADKVFLTLKEGTENSLTSGESYSDEAIEDGTGGVIYAHDDLTINGSGSLTITGSYKHGIEGNDELVITGGTISITAPGDGIHVNDSVRIMEADLTISSGDDGIHCDTEVYIESGTVLITECYEGIEAPQIEVTGGDITIYPTDDGFNANGGTSMMGMGGFGGMMHGNTTAVTDSGNSAEKANSGNTDAAKATDTTDTTEELSEIRISGGTITIINESARDADGLDSNGNIYISGGTIRISLSGSGSNNAIDYGSESGGVCEITGGSVIACGSYSMAEAFDSSSTQCAILYNFSDGADAGTTLAVEDADGNVLVSWEVPCSFNSANISIPELTLGETYLIAIGDNVEEITLEEVSASYGDAASSAFGGTMNWGGMRQRQKTTTTDGTAATGSTDGTAAESTEGTTSSDSSAGTGFGPAGRGGFGPGGKGGQRPWDAQNSDGTMPQPPEGMTEGEMPQPPEGMTEGEMPQPPEGMTEGEMPQPPEGMTEGEMPQPPEGMTEGEMPGQPGAGAGMGPMSGENTQDASGAEAVSGGTALSDFDSDTWIELGACAAVLCAAIAAALLFRRGRTR